MAKSTRYRDTLAMSGSELYSLLQDPKDAAKAEKSHFETEQRGKQLVGAKHYDAWRTVQKYYEYPAANASQHMGHVYAYCREVLASTKA